MEQERGMATPGPAELPVEEAAWGTDEKAPGERSGPTWRGFVLSILAAVILSVMATLLLGGSFPSYSLRPAPAVSSGGCGAGADCCPPAVSRN